MRPPLHILIVAEVFHPDTVGGAGRVAAELAKGLARQGHAVRVVARATPAAPDPFEEREGFAIFRYRVNPGNPFTVLTATKAGLAEALARALAGFHPNVIDLHQPLSAYHALAHPALAGLPVVYTFHSSWADELTVRGKAHALFAPVARRIERTVLSTANRIVVLSEYSRRLVAKASPEAATEIVPGGVDLERFPMKTRSGRSSPPVILSIRNLVRRMGLELLIESAILLKREGRAFELRIGGSGVLGEELMTLARPLGSACRFLGHVPEDHLPHVYREADLFVLPTTAIEGFGLVILEAFASGTPVIGTPVGAIPELVGLQGDGYVASEPSAEPLKRLIARFLDAERPVEGARLRRIAEDYSWSRRAQRVVEIHGRLVEASVRGQ